MGTNRRRVRSENRAPAVIALLIGVALLVALPGSFPWPLHYGVGALEVVLIAPLVALNPSRLSRETPWSKAVSRVAIILLLVANLLALADLLVQLVSADTDNSPRLLLAAVQVWLTNAIAFSLLFWELDRGGPVRRRHAEPGDLPPADLHFPQEGALIAEPAAEVEVVDGGTPALRGPTRSSAVLSSAELAAVEADLAAARPPATPGSPTSPDSQAVPTASLGGWVSSYLDYFYAALRNGMAVIRPDAIPLTTRAKALMAVQAFSGFVLLGTIVARAVSLLG